MNLFDNLIKSIIVLISLLLFLLLYEMQGIKSSLTRFYEYEGKKINLTQVKVIEARVDYIISYQNSDRLDTFYRHSVQINPAEITKITKLLEDAYKSNFYEVELLMYLHFDENKLLLYKSPYFLKIPDSYTVNDYLLKVLKSYGIDEFQYKGLKSIENKLYRDKEKFLDDVLRLGKLKESSWSKENIPLLGMGEKGAAFMKKVQNREKENALDVQEIEKITEALHRVYEEYMSIQ